MSSVLHFSPAFKPSSSLLDFSSLPHESSKKRKRGLDPLGGDGGDVGGEELETDSAANGTRLPLEYTDPFVTTSAPPLDVDTSHGYDALNSRTSSHTNHEGLHASTSRRSVRHRIADTAPLMSKGRISDELASLKSPLYVTTRRVPAATAEQFSRSTGLRQHHLSTITAILHRYLMEGDYIRAGRAWAMLLRAEQNGHSMDLRTHGRWGVGAEILMKRESQMAQKTLAHGVFGTSSSTSNLGVKAESMEKAKEYYERMVLQYPYRKAFPNAIGPLNFSIAMFSLWIYTVKEQSTIALMTVGSSDKNNDETDAEENAEVQRSSASNMEPDRYREHEQVRGDTLHSAHEIATRLDGLLVSPPYSDNARFWKLYGEILLWIADLSVASIVVNYSSSISGGDEDLTVESPSLLRNVSRSTTPNVKHRAGKERQDALAKAKKAFQMAKGCGEISAE